MNDRPRGKPVIEARGYGAELLAGHEADGEFNAIIEKQADTVTLFHPQIGQEIGQPVDPCVKITERIGAIFKNYRIPARPIGCVSKELFRLSAEHQPIPPNSN